MMAITNAHESTVRIVKMYQLNPVVVDTMWDMGNKWTPPSRRWDIRSRRCGNHRSLTSTWFDGGGGGQWMNIEVYHRYGYARNVSIDEVIVLLQGRSIALKFMHVYYIYITSPFFQCWMLSNVLVVGSRIPGIKDDDRFWEATKEFTGSPFNDVPWKPCGNAISHHHSSNSS